MGGAGTSGNTTHGGKISVLWITPTGLQRQGGTMELSRGHRRRLLNDPLARRSRRMVLGYPRLFTLVHRSRHAAHDDISQELDILLCIPDVRQRFLSFANAIMKVLELPPEGLLE